MAKPKNNTGKILISLVMIALAIMIFKPQLNMQSIFGYPECPNCDLKAGENQIIWEGDSGAITDGLASILDKVQRVYIWRPGGWIINYPPSEAPNGGNFIHGEWNLIVLSADASLSGCNKLTIDIPDNGIDENCDGLDAISCPNCFIKSGLNHVYWMGETGPIQTILGSAYENLKTINYQSGGLNVQTSWKTYNTLNPESATLKNLTKGEAYWIQMNTDTSLDIQIEESLICPGCNLISGWNNFTWHGPPTSIELAIEPIQDNVGGGIWWYDSQTNSWKVYIVDEPRFSDLLVFKPEQTYYMLTNNSINWPISKPEEIERSQSLQLTGKETLQPGEQSQKSINLNVTTLLPGKDAYLSFEVRGIAGWDTKSEYYVFSFKKE